MGKKAFGVLCAPFVVLVLAKDNQALTSLNAWNTNGCD
jgi:hypothetical protein